MGTMTKAHARGLHFFSSHNKSLCEDSKRCGCFYCKKTFRPNEIKEWVDADPAETALCPKCGIDSVLPGCVVSISKRVLGMMQEQFFMTYATMEDMKRDARYIKILRGLPASQRKVIRNHHARRYQCETINW